MTEQLDITRPLRLAVGSHKRGSGRGCAMNLISWETGETTISDYPACADGVLARLTQFLNDHYCQHVEAEIVVDGPEESAARYLCPPCSQFVLDVAHRTVGTGELGLDDNQLHRLYLQLALRETARLLDGPAPDEKLHELREKVAGVIGSVQHLSDSHASPQLRAYHENECHIWYSQFFNADPRNGPHGMVGAALSGLLRLALQPSSDAKDVQWSVSAGEDLMTTIRNVCVFLQWRELLGYLREHVDSSFVGWRSASHFTQFSGSPLHVVVWSEDGRTRSATVSTGTPIQQLLAQHIVAAFDAFEELTGHKGRQVEPVRVTRAYCQMTSVR